MRPALLLCKNEQISQMHSGSAYKCVTNSCRFAISATEISLPSCLQAIHESECSEVHFYRRKRPGECAHPYTMLLEVLPDWGSLKWLPHFTALFVFLPHLRFLTGHIVSGDKNAHNTHTHTLWCRKSYFASIITFMAVGRNFVQHLSFVRQHVTNKSGML